MSTAAILDRLQVCNREVSGNIKRAFRLHPTKPIQPSDLPCVMMRPRGMLRRVPGTTAGQYVVSRRYEGTVLVSRAAVASLDTSDEGAKLMADVEPWLDLFIDYFVSHPRLQTNGGNLLDELVLSEDISYQDTDPDVLVGSDGNQYGGFTFTVDIAERRVSTALSYIS